MKVLTFLVVISLLCFLKSNQAAESGHHDHDHESDEAMANILTSIMAASNTSMTFANLNDLANRMVPNRTCASCSMVNCIYVSVLCHKTTCDMNIELS